MRSLVRDGVALGYELAEGEGTPILLVHGWCCDHSYFGPQFEHFRDRGRTVLAVDLRGHGESDEPEGAYSMDVFADDLAWLASELRLERPVVIGHSMGGVIAFELAVTHPGVPGAIVMIDSPVARPAASRDGMPAFLEKLNGPGYRDAVTEYVAETLFLPTDQAERRAEILARMPETARHVMISAFEGMRDFDPDDARGPIGVPSLFIAADDRPLSDLPHLFQLAPDMLFGQTVGSGHFCTLEVPDQVNPMLDRFLTVLPSMAEGSAGTRT
jgi:pimeloyl-ACP methyl ester carboxylesterase